MSNQVVIYWAAPCFTQAERYWNRCCVKSLASYGYKVILPQDEAEQFIGDGGMDFKGLAEHCKDQAISSDVIVAILDGPDPDSGMSMECGLIIGANGGFIVGVRTDFRVAEDGQLNAMFRLLDDVIYYPAFSESFEDLCKLIDEHIRARLHAKEDTFIDREVVFYDPHSGFGGASVPLPESLKCVADELNDKRMFLSQAVECIRKAIPRGVLSFRVEVNCYERFIVVELEYNIAYHGWALIHFKEAN
jgi:nucleoside 2-deoxyribosyltransferase